jgi:tyrosyl-tRNA synthetase
MAPSKGEARRLIQQGGVLVNDAKVDAIDAAVDADALRGDGIIVRKGKKTYRRFCLK